MNIYLMQKSGFLFLELTTCQRIISYIFVIYCFRLTQRELIEREHKKKLLVLAKEHEKARELENVQRYRMPQDIKDDQMQYEVEVDKAPTTEQQKWEEEQMASAVYRFGAKGQEKEQYELLIDNQIEFIQTANLPGTHDVCVFIFILF